MKRLPIFAMLVFSFFILPVAFADLPKVHKVEPPNWWAGHSLNPIQILIRGEELQKAKIVTDFGSVENIKINKRGTYAIIAATIEPDTKPGGYQIAIQTPEGGVYAPFEISQPLEREGRFQGFSSNDIVYLLMPDRFSNGDESNDDPEISKGMLDRKRSRYYHGGDLQGVIDRLPYLKELGITAIWMNPIYDNVNALNQKEVYDDGAITDYHGYGAVDFYAVEEHFGTIELLRELVDKAHGHGIKIIQDQVANHTGPYHPWVNDSPTPTWLNGTAGNHLANVWQTWTLPDPYASPALQKETLEGWFIDILPDLNQNDPQVSTYLIQNTLWWIGMAGIDGIRQDTLPYVHRKFWRDWMKAIKKEYPDFIVVGEMLDGNVVKNSFFQGGAKRFDGIDSGIDSLFDFPLYYKIRGVFANGGSIREIPQTLAHDPLYADPSLLMTILGLHDVPRFMNEANASRAGLKLAYTFMLTARGIPLIYYGDEIGMAGGGDPDNRRDFPGGWKQDAQNAFAKDGRTPEQNDVFEHISKLTELRQKSAALRRGKTINLYADDNVYAYARIHDDETLIVALNNSLQSQRITIPISGVDGADNSVWKDQLKINPDGGVANGGLTVSLQPRTGSIYASGL